MPRRHPAQHEARDGEARQCVGRRRGHQACQVPGKFRSLAVFTSVSDPYSFDRDPDPAF